MSDGVHISEMWGIDICIFKLYTWQLGTFVYNLASPDILPEVHYECYAINNPSSHINILKANGFLERHTEDKTRMLPAKETR